MLEIVGALFLEEIVVHGIEPPLPWLATPPNTPLGGVASIMTHGFPTPAHSRRGQADYTDWRVFPTQPVNEWGNE